MSREDRTATDIARISARLARWAEGVVLPTAQGPHLCWVTGVAEPRLVHDACRAHGAPPRDVLERALRMPRPPVPLDARLVRAAARDLSQLEAALRHGGRRARRVRAAGARRLHALATRLGAQERAFHALRAMPAPAPATTPREALARTLRFVAALRGDAAVALFAGALDAYRADVTLRAECRRALLQRLLGALASGEPIPPLDGDPPALGETLAAHLESMRAVRALPGRARVRRLIRVVARALDLPESAASAVPRPVRIAAAHAELDAAAHLLGEAMIAAAPPERTDPPPPDLDALACAAACLALVVDPATATPPPAEDLSLCASRLDAVLAVAHGARPCLSDVVTLLRLAIRRQPDKAGVAANELKRLARMVGAGIEPAALVAMQAEGELGDALEVEGAGAAAYIEWQPRLKASYAAASLRLDLPREAFHPEHQPASRAHAVLGACLLRHHLEAPEVRTDDASGGLFQAIHAVTRALAPFGAAAAPVHDALDRLRAPGTGLARAHEPELSAWLGDEALLDRYLQLTTLAGEAPRVSSAVRSDFERAARRQRERIHLESLPIRERLQQKRLELLRKSEGAPTDLEPTRRDLAVRIREGWPAAWRACLERALLRVLRTAWGIRLRTLDAGWKAVLRYQLVCEDNRDLLDWLLRAAAASPGRDLALCLPKAAAWAEQARRRFDVDAFRAPRRRPVTVDGTTYVIVTEQDPVEVLRMGMPFETCLGLEEGCNAGSTVTNALEPNKRVLYVRDAAGAIVGRKLIAVSSRYELLGYNFYCSLEAARAKALEAEVDALCREIAAAARAPVADSGEPEKVLGGFWYDDGPRAFTPLPPAVTEAYCAHLGRALPEHHGDMLDEARGWAAIERGDVGDALAMLSTWPHGPAHDALGAGVLARLGEAGAEATARANDHTALAFCLVRDAARRGLRPALTLAARIGHCVGDLDDALDPLLAAEPDAGTARHWVRAARQCRRLPAPEAELARLSTEALLRHARCLGVAALLQLCDAIEPAWLHGARKHLQGESSRQAGVVAMQRLAVAAYARRRAPDAVLACLRNGRRSQLAHLAALAIAAELTLDDKASETATAPWQLTFMEEAPRPLPAVTRALHALLERQPTLASHPNAMAALLRHGLDPRAAAALPSAEPPFEALGPLLLWVPEVMSGLARFAPVASAEKWSPGPWEVHYHRTQPSPWKRALAARVDLREAEGAAAARWLGRLGEAALLERLVQRKWSPDFVTGNPPEGRRAVVENALADARSVAAQLAGQAPFAECRQADAIDPLTQRRAMTRLRASLDESDPRGPLPASAPTDGDAARALGVLLRSQSTTEWRRGMIEWMVERGVATTMDSAAQAVATPGDDAAGVTPSAATATTTFGEALRQLVDTQHDQLHLAPARIWAALQRQAPLRAAVVTALRAPAHTAFEHVMARIERAAEDGPGARDLFERCLVDRVQAGRQDVVAQLGETALLRAFAALREREDAALWLRAFAAVPDYRGASRVIAELEAAWRAPLGSARAPSAPAIAQALEDEKPWGRDKLKTFRAWLLAATTAEVARVMPPPPSRGTAQLLLQGTA